MMRENVRLRRTRQFLLLRTKKATASQEKNQGRDSLSRESELEKIVKTQAESVPLIVKKAIVCFSCVAAFFFLVTGIFTVSVAPTCDDALYRHCDVRVPFCGFQVSCNCAVLRIQNHNMTVLPPAIESMIAMKKMEVTNGPLEELPKKMGEYMPLLAKLTVDFNKLKTLPESLAKAEHLVFLYASYFRRQSHNLQQLRNERQFRMGVEPTMHAFSFVGLLSMKMF